MVSNMHSCHSTETMPWLVILTDQSTSLLSPPALLKSSCSQWTLRHEKAVDVATMSISQSERRSDPQSILLRGQKREVFALSATYPLIKVLLKINRSIWHPLLEKNRPKVKAKDTVSSFPKTGKQHLTHGPATHLPRSNHRLLWAAIMHTPHWPTARTTLCDPYLSKLNLNLHKIFVSARLDFAEVDENVYLLREILSINCQMKYMYILFKCTDLASWSYW